MVRTAIAVALAAAPLVSQGEYFPPRGEWGTASAGNLGLNQAALDSARAFAIRNESTAPRDQAEGQRRSFGAREPFSQIIGPMRERGDPSGIVVFRGKVVAQWGPVDRVDMTHSVTKTFLSTTVGLAWRDGLIRNVQDRASVYMPAEIGLFESDHNSSITWDHLLRQSSDWQGTLWGKHDWADRPRGPADSWRDRELHEPGSHYKYNDVRVNVLAFALMQVVREPLPQMLRLEIMDPIGASSTWRWYGYDNSWAEVDGQKMQSVSGGGHWGGGMFINAWDMARFGYLFLRGGAWDGRQLVPTEWIAMARTPGPANNRYGYMNWFLNTDQRMLPSAPESAVAFLGNGQNIIYVDVENDLVVVLRWLGGGSRVMDGVIGRIINALPAS